MEYSTIVSRQFVDRLKRHHERAYVVAWRTGVHPCVLSKLIHGAERVRPGDPRIIAVGRELGLSPLTSAFTHRHDDECSTKDRFWGMIESTTSTTGCQQAVQAFTTTC